MSALLCRSPVRRLSRELAAPSGTPAGGPQNRRAGAEQEPEVVPIPGSCGVIERELLPAAEDMDDKDDPGRKAVPEPPEQVRPPHDDLLLLIVSDHQERFRSPPELRVRSSRSGPVLSLP